MSIDARRDRSAATVGRPWRIAPVIVVAALGIALTVVDAYLRTDAASAIVGDEPLPDSPGWIAAVAVLLQAVALWWRTRWPVTVLIAATAVDVALLALSSGTLSVGSIAVMIAAYTVFRWRSGASVYLWAGLAALVSTLAVWLFVEPDSGIPAGWQLPIAVLRTALTYLVPALIAELVASRARAMVVLRERAELAEREQERNARDAVQRERDLIARELHDIAAHHLSGIIVGAQAAGALVAAEPDRAREYIRTVARDAQLTLANLRQTVGLLRSDGQGELAPAPTIAQIAVLLAGLRDSGMRIAEEWSGVPVELGPVAQAAAYRMVQESLANARQHAPGAACTVSVVNDTRATTITVSNSRPAHTGPQPPLGGHGLVGMRERAALTGSRLTVGPTGDGGWSNELVLPAPDIASDTEGGPA